MTEPIRRTTRAQRMAMPLARDVVRDWPSSTAPASARSSCAAPTWTPARPRQVLVPCGHTLATVCPSCADRAKTLRAAQCREGWHLENEPILEPDPATDEIRSVGRDARRGPAASATRPTAAGQDTADLDELITELDEEITSSGMRGNVRPGQARAAAPLHPPPPGRPDLPKRKISPRTVGKTYTAPDGKTFRPSLFLTLTCPSYGRVAEDGTPADPATYDYDRAARDALHFAALFDRFIQNLRRYLGYDVQYFAAVEPQRRLAPHVHLAMRGTVSRAELRRVLAATYHQVWWPDATVVKYDGTSCRSGMRGSAATWTRPPGRCCPTGIRPWMPSVRRMSRGTWPGSGSGSTPRACSPDRRTPRGASGT